MSGRVARGLVLLVALFAAAADPARAQGTQPAQPSKGWLELGSGYVAFRSDCENCEHGDAYTSGRGVLVDGGIAVNERFDAGGGIFTAFSGDAANHYRTTYLLGVGQFRPWKHRGFFLKGGFGLVYLRGEFTVDGQRSEVSSRGLGASYGAGWVFGQGRRVSFAPYGAQYVATMGDIPFPAGTALNAVSNAWVAGVVVLIR